MAWFAAAFALGRGPEGRGHCHECYRRMRETKTDVGVALDRNTTLSDDCLSCHWRSWGDCSCVELPEVFTYLGFSPDPNWESGWKNQDISVTFVSSVDFQSGEVLFICCLQHPYVYVYIWKSLLCSVWTVKRQLPLLKILILLVYELCPCFKFIRIQNQDPDQNWSIHIQCC